MKFHKYDENVINELISYFENVTITDPLKFQIKSTLNAIKEILKIYPNLQEYKIISTNCIEVLFSIFKSKTLYPDSFEYYNNINNCWDITKLILSQKKNFNVPKNFVSDYYNIETINIFENFFDDIIIDKVEKFELTETQSKLLELHKPKDKELSLRDKVSSTEVIILLPCPYVSSSINLCDHYEDLNLLQI
jgi:hypothetical protein